MIVLDTDVLVDVMRGYAPASAWFSALSEQPAVSGFTVLEVQAGCRDATELRRAATLLGRLRVVWPSSQTLSSVTQWFGSIHLQRGTGVLDALIGATCVEHAAELATFNARHMRAVPGLVLAQVYVR